MITLLIWACLAGQPDNCRVLAIADGFTSDEKCIAYSGMLIIGWLSMHPGARLREGVGPICTDRPEYLKGRFGA